jgi:hypothetical protein
MSDKKEIEHYIKDQVEKVVERLFRFLPKPDNFIMPGCVIIWIFTLILLIYHCTHKKMSYLDIKDTEIVQPKPSK